MRLSFNLEYFGDCKQVLDFYGAVFENASVYSQTYRGMDMADILGITGQGLDMIWQSELCIPYGDSVLRLEMSDSLMTAMQKNKELSQLFYHPVICIQHEDENEIRGVLRKLYGAQENFTDLQTGNAADFHGICWQYQKSSCRGISYCLTFDGFCSDVIAFYENTFAIKAEEIIKYSDSPYRDKISTAGADMIYSAELRFYHGDQYCALNLSDSYESAVNGINNYDPNALLFYQKMYNPIFTLRDNDIVYLSETFARLANGAKLNRPITPDDNGNLFGSLIDRYGICWNFYSRGTINH